MKTKILTIGGSGLVGSRAIELLSQSYDVSDLSRASGLDITDKNLTLEKIEKSEAEIVILFAAKADVDGCEKDKILGENGEAWKINVIGAQNVAVACEQVGKKMIYISTDFVFSGDDMSEGGYSEEDIPNPINWYGKTKFEGENMVRSLTSDWLIIRPAYPYRADFPKKDFARVIKERLSQNLPVAAIEDHLMTPTFVDDIAIALNLLIDSNSQGIFHVVGSQSLSPYEVALEIASVFNFDKKLITKTTREDFFKNRALRPFQLGLKNDKIRRLGANMSTFIEGLQTIKSQL